MGFSGYPDRFRTDDLGRLYRLNNEVIALRLSNTESGKPVQPPKKLVWIGTYLKHQAWRRIQKSDQLPWYSPKPFFAGWDER